MSSGPMAGSEMPVSIAQSNPKRAMDKLEFEYCRAMAWVQVYASTTSRRSTYADQAVVEFEQRFEARPA